MDYKKEFFRLLEIAQQATDGGFKSKCANSMLKGAVEIYNDPSNYQQENWDDYDWDLH